MSEYVDQLLVKVDGLTQTIKELNYVNDNLKDSLNRTLSSLKCGQCYYLVDGNCIGFECDFERKTYDCACETFHPKEEKEDI